MQVTSFIVLLLKLQCKLVYIVQFVFKLQPTPISKQKQSDAKFVILLFPRYFGGNHTVFYLFLTFRQYFHYNLCKNCNIWLKQKHLTVHIMRTNLRFDDDTMVREQIVYKGSFTNYVYKTRQVGGPKMSSFFQRSCHRKYQRRRVGG